jgi:RHS repeat-associated protein
VAVELGRDALGRVVEERRTDEDGVTRKVASRYDYSGYRVERESELGHRLEYKWSDAGDLTGMSASVSRGLQTPAIRSLGLPALSLESWDVAIARDRLGLEVARRLPGGVVAMWKRDAHGKPLQRRVQTGAFPGKTPTQVQSLGYQWNGPDQIAAIIDTQAGPTRFDYDPRGHLVRALFPTGEVQHRAADPAGNIFKTADGSDRTYERGGRLVRVGSTELRYDGQGQLLEKKLADGARWKYIWSPGGRLLEVERPDGERVRFAYDALGRRVRTEFRDEATEYIWDGDDLLHEQVTRAGEKQPVVTWVFEPGTFAPVGKLEGRKRYSVVTDHLGTPSLLMTEAGRLAWKAQLDVYGVVREDRGGVAEGDATGCPWRYPGQYEDPETGLYYNRFRYYDPETGTYISQDPIGLPGGLNLHAYPGDPALWADPLGLSACRRKKTHVFWSGNGNPRVKKAAQQWARENGAVTLERTGRGSHLEMHSASLDWIEAAPHWLKASTKFAKEAEGEVHVFLNKTGISPTSVWNTVEKPILEAKGVKIVYHDI